MRESNIEDHIIVRRVCNQIVGPQCSQKTVRAAGYSAISAQGNHWDSHPKGVQRRSRTVVRECVERDIHVADCGEIFAHRFASAERHLRDIDAVLLHSREKGISGFCLTNIEGNEFRPRYLLKYARPKGETLIADLDALIK